MTTIRTVLFGELLPTQVGSTAPKIEEAAERLAAVGGVPQRPEATPVAMARQVVAKVADLLNVEVSDVLVGAWRTRSALLEAARESLREPDTHRQVTIKTYSLPWDYAVDVDLTLNGARVATISFGASVELEVTALAAVIQNGRIIRLSAGEVTVRVALQITSQTPVPVGLPLAHGERTLPLNHELTLPGSGLSLVDQPTVPAG